MNKIKNKAELLLALLYAGQEHNSRVEGITRLEKLLFLLKKEKNFLNDVQDKDDFHFFPFRMGPWTNEVYDEVDFLDSLGLVKKDKNTKDTPADTASLDELFNNTLLDRYQKNESKTFDKGTESFSLTEKGIEKAKQLWSNISDDQKRDIIEIRSKFNSMDLKKFLRYVYINYPEFASASEIKDSLGL